MDTGSFELELYGFCLSVIKVNFNAPAKVSFPIDPALPSAEVDEKTKLPSFA